MTQLSTHTRRQLGYAEGFLALGMKTHAVEALDEISGAEKDATPVLAMRQAAHVELAQWEGAAALGALLCGREPHVAGHWIQWAYATRRHAGLAEARVILSRGVGVHPREAMFHFNLACYEAQLGNLGEARAFLDVACGLDPLYAELAKTDSDLDPLRG